MTDNHYQDVLDALMEKIRTFSTYFPKSVYVSMNHEDVGRGNDYWFICTPSAFPKSRLDGQDVIYQWQTDCNLFVRYKTEKDSIPKLIAVRSTIINGLHAPRAIKDLGIKSITVTGDKLKQDVPPPAVPNFIIQPLLITIEQIVKR